MGWKHLAPFARLSRMPVLLNAPKILSPHEDCLKAESLKLKPLSERPCTSSTFGLSVAEGDSGGSTSLQKLLSFGFAVGGSLTVAFAALGAGQVMTQSSCEPAPIQAPVQEWHMLNIDHRRRAFFVYEKRIREMSPQEKQFEYFASEGDASSGFVMSPADVMRSVVAVYPPTGSSIIRAGSLPGEPMPQVPQHQSKFFEAFDLDKSGGLSFDEWLLIVSLLSIPVDDVEGILSFF